MRPVWTKWVSNDNILIAIVKISVIYYMAIEHSDSFKTLEALCPILVGQGNLIITFEFILGELK